MFKTENCSWCGWDTTIPDGVLLPLIAGDRLMCGPCGRFTLECECPPPPDVARAIEHRRREGPSPDWMYSQ